MARALSNHGLRRVSIGESPFKQDRLLAATRLNSFHQIIQVAGR
jgi:hypothetical protein